MKIFDFVKKTTTAHATPASDTIINENPIPINPDEKQVNETYTRYGIRICGKMMASIHALPPFMQKIYLNEKNRQANDIDLQDRLKKEIQQKIIQLDTEIETLGNKLECTQQQKNYCEEKILDTKKQIAQLKQCDVDEDRMEKMKMYIGIIILMPLTIYLFIFYSSTFYSAFLDHDITGEIKISDAMFNPQALTNALNVGFGELLFVLFAPVIFLGLGFTLHIFSQQKGVIKYIKTLSVLIITFIFDCILAYSIAKNKWDIYVMTHDVPDKEYTIAQAFTDEHVWAVIFCGFIAYIIWGLVFDMTMGAYEKRVSNRFAIEMLQLQLDKDNQKQERLIQEIQRLKDDIACKEGTKKELYVKTTMNAICIDNNIIKLCISDFFTGWLQQMATLMCTEEEQDKANNVYNQTITTLFPA